MPEQLPLPFTFNAGMEFRQFHPGVNAEPVRHLQTAAAGSGERLVFLWGGPGSGKTHLLNACCHEASQQRRTAAYLPLSLLEPHGPESLEGMEGMDLVCLDDVQAVAGDSAWEAALFVLFNRLREQGRSLIAAAEKPPGQLPIHLADLRTRFGWGLILRLQPLPDADKLAALGLYARSLGLELSPAVGRFLLARYPRNLAALRRLLDHLDQATLAAKRRLTVPFVKTVLGRADPASFGKDR